MSRLCLALVSCCMWMGHPVLAETSAVLDAGINDEVEIDVEVTSAPCGLEAGDRVQFLVSARNMVNVSQVYVEFGWRPAGAIASMVGIPVGGAQQKIFMVPGASEIEEDRTEFGMASLADSLAGDSDLARFAFELGPSISAATKVDVWIQEVSLGPNSYDRDVIRPVEAMVLSNYCDADEEVVLTPEQASLPFSEAPRGQAADGSAGELLLTARVFQDGSLLADQEVSWTMDNLGSTPVYVLVAEQILRVDQGGSQQGSARSDDRGVAYIVLDAEGDAGDGAGEARLEVCSEVGSEQLCAASVATWHAATMVEGQNPVVPGRFGLGQNYPNPLNAATIIPFSVPARPVGALRLDILNLAGQIVGTLVHGTVRAGRHQVTWDGRSREGTVLASGVYLCRLRLGEEETVRPLVLLR